MAETGFRSREMHLPLQSIQFTFLGFSLHDAPVQHRPGRCRICLPMRDLHRPPVSTVFSCYETVANLQPEGNRQVPGAQAKNSHET